jgi:hypothetical protein
MPLWALRTNLVTGWELQRRSPDFSVNRPVNVVLGREEAVRHIQGVRLASLVTFDGADD